MNELVKAVGKLLEPRQNRCRDVFARSSDGYSVFNGYDNDACQWCLVGAIEKVAHDPSFSSYTYADSREKLKYVVMHKLYNAKLTKYPYSSLIELWDNSSDAEQDTIVQVLLKD